MSIRDTASVKIPASAWASYALRLVICVCAAPLALADEVVDFNGVWGYSHLGPPVAEDGSVPLTLPARDGSVANFERDFAVLERNDENMPLYKPEHWERIRELDFSGVTEDPIFNCRPAGVPRVGAPQQIVQSDDTMVFLYANQGEKRIVHIDGRKLIEAQIYDYSWHGYSVGRFESGKLIIETRGFNDQSWLGWAGWVHSADMVVTETLWVENEALHWVATVEDPMLLAPWTTNEQVKRRNPDPEVFLWEAPPCEELDREHMVEDTRG